MTRAALGVLFSLMLCGCAESRPTMLGAPLSGVNHTSAAINYFSVNGSVGPNIGPYGGGPRSQKGAAVLPLKWRPGLMVVVEWEKDPNVGASVNWPPLGTEGYRAEYRKHAAKYTRHRAVVEVAPYSELGALDVHFLPCDQVKVAAGTAYYGHPDHPYKFPRRMEVPNPCPIP
ncbi:MAG: DUF3304 domain-containing protein [Pseudomonadota bacterium]